MADEIKKVIEVDVSGALDSIDDLRDEVVSAGYSFKSLGDAKKYIDRLRASLIDLDETSAEYAERVDEIDKVQDKLNKAMKATGDRTKDAEGSYNALSKQMSELKKAFKATNDEAEREVLAKQIVNINDQLKEMDASIGNYQRNVGNYEAAFTDGLLNIAAKVKALSDPMAIATKSVNALGKAMKALIANPIGAIIMAIVVAVKALKKGFEQSETATNSLKRAFSALQPIINAISNVFTGFANIVGSIAEKAIPALVNGLQKASDWMMSLLNKLGIVSDEKLESFRKSIEAQKEAVKTTQELTDREIALTERKRKFMEDEARLEMEISELRSKATNKDKYSAKERQKFLNDAIAKEREINKEKLAIAQEEYDIMKKRSELTDNDAATNDALAAASANLYNTKREYYEKERELVSQLQAAGQELSAAEKKRLEDAKKIAEQAEEIKKEELKKAEEIKERAELSLLSNKDRELKILEDKYKEEKALLEKYEQDTTKLTEEYEKKKQEIINSNGLDKAKEINERAIQSLMNGTDRQLDVLKKRYEEEKKLLEANGIDTVNLTKEYERQVAEAKAGAGEGKINDINDNSSLERDIADKTIQNEFEKNKKLLQIDRERLEGTKAIYEELYNLDGLSEEQKQEYANKLKEIDADLAENSKQMTELKKEEAMSLLNTYGQVAQGIGDLMGTISDIWQDSIKERVKNGKITEEEGKKEFEKSKKLQIATAIINGLAGVAMAVSTAMSLGPIAGPIMAAVNSAMVIATTAAQIAKIKSTTFDSGGSSVGGDVSSSASSASPTSAAMEYKPQYSTNITGDSEAVNLANAVNEGQKDQRVYVVESDINEAGKRVEVRESESTF